MTIRAMTAEDIDEVIRLGVEMHKESRYSRFNFDPYKCKILGFEIVDNPDMYFGYIIEHAGKIQGFMLAFMTEFYFGNERIAQDLALFVQKTRRGCMDAVNLIKKYQEWAIKNGADEIQLGITTGVNEKRTTKLYQKLGFNQIGTVFKKES